MCGTLAVAFLLENYNPKRFKISDFQDQMIKNAQNTNPGCKNAAYEFYKAAYKWIGENVLT